MSISIRMGSVFLLCLTLAACNTVDKYLTLRFWEPYKTEIKTTYYKEDLKKIYDTDVLLKLDDNKKFAELIVQGSRGLSHMGDTDKASLHVWDSVFNEFLAWSPTGPEVVDKTSDVKAQIDGRFILKRELKFMVIDGKKMLVFINHASIGSSDSLYAFDEDNVRKIIVLYQQLDDILI